ncbi:leucine-rich repeat-containing protein 37A2-like isoform X1 [Nycticebus coucang]|uniref:leucine-rich repeat-containing protein 37A2-like isoform X1 n=1 Tax=Nycticebus coucang TaxID=9470 RepID=UPI00234E0EE3|nr:leucine-rich repeat-containing protein 37A2-like isoform X1 [Nycticebus coucang]
MSQRAGLERVSTHHMLNPTPHCPSVRGLWECERKLIHGREDWEEKYHRTAVILICKWGFFEFLHRRCSSQSESQEGFFWLRRPLWLRVMYRPLNATRKKNMAQKLYDKESSDEEEIYKKDAGEPISTATPVDSAAEGGEESETVPEGEDEE